MREASNLFPQSGVTVDGSYSLTVGLPPMTSGYITTTALAFSTVYTRVTLKSLRDHGATNETLCGTVPEGTVSDPGFGLYPGFFALTSPATSEYNQVHEGEYTRLKVCCCPCRPVLLLPRHDPSDPADSPPEIGTISYTWTDGGTGDPDPGPIPDVKIYGWGRPEIFPRRCRPGFYNPDGVNYTYDDTPQSVVVREVVHPHLSEEDATLNRTSEWTAIVNGQTSYGTFQLAWNTPPTEEKPSALVTLTFQMLPLPLAVLPVAIPSGRWTLILMETDDPDFDIADLQITAETGGVRVAFLGPYRYRKDLEPLELVDATNATKSLAVDLPLPDQQISGVLDGYILDGLDYVSWGSPRIDVNKGTNCMVDLSGTDTVDLSNPVDYITGSYTINVTWS